MKLKKIASLIASLALISALACLPAQAQNEKPTVYVTIANGALVLTQEAVTLTDADGDGALTVNDALYLAHEARFDGGAAAGYASSVGAYGLSLTKLWGVQNGGSYGYYVNNAAAMGLSDPVGDGDFITAFVYTDTASFSDVYCYFDVNTAEAAAGEGLTLTLFAAGYDSSWNPVAAPLAGAEIVIDGKAADLRTDAEGRVTLTLGVGKHTVSARSDAVVLVPPVCTVTVSAASPSTADPTAAFIAIAALSFGIFACLALHVKKEYEK